jgi:hypothetical protein
LVGVQVKTTPRPPDSNRSLTRSSELRTRAIKSATSFVKERIVRFTAHRLTITGFGGAFGGGLDIKVSDRIDFRVIQVDYNPVYTRSSFNNNVRIGVGIVFK